MAEYIGDRIKEIRKALNLNQTEFGEKLSVKQTTIAGYETNAKNPLDTVLNSICMVYNVNREYLLNGEGPMFQEISKENQLMMWAGKILWNESDTFKRRFVNMLMSLNESDWETLEKIATALAKED